VPLYAKKKAQRGFNQAEVIARAALKHLRDRRDSNCAAAHSCVCATLEARLGSVVINGERICVGLLRSAIQSRFCGATSCWSMTFIRPGPPPPNARAFFVARARGGCGSLLWRGLSSFPTFPQCPRSLTFCHGSGAGTATLSWRG
jgi:hypothetical protein